MYLQIRKNYKPRALFYRWEIPELVPEESLQKVIDAVARLAEMEDIYLHSVDREKNFVQIFCYTKAGWLDVVEINLYPGRFQGTQGNVRKQSKIERREYSSHFCFHYNIRCL